MQEVEFRKQVASIYEEVKKFSEKYEDTYLEKIGENPHITRLIEAFSFLHGKLYDAMDTSHSKLISSLIDLIYPHLNKPIPSSLFVEFISSKDQMDVIYLEKGSIIQMKYKDKKVNMSLAYKTEMVPFYVVDIYYDIVEDITISSSERSKVVISVKPCNDSLLFKDVNFSKFRFYINAVDSVSYSIYNSIFKNLIGVVISHPRMPHIKFTLEKESIFKVGFSHEENMLSEESNIFNGYRFLTEFFFFHNKFFFFDLKFDSSILKNFDNNMRIELLFSDESLEGVIKSSTLLLNVAPTINLFERESDPIEIEVGRSSYPLVVDKKHTNENVPYSVKEVIVGGEKEEIKAKPISEASIGRGDEILWNIEHQKSDIAENNLNISLISQEFFKSQRYFYAKMICFNGDVLQQIFSVLQEKINLYFLNDTVLVQKIVPLFKPTKVKKICANLEERLKLLSHLSVHYLNILESEDAKKILKSIFSIYKSDNNVADSALIRSMEKVEVIDHIDRISTSSGFQFAKGYIFRIHFSSVDVVPEGMILLFCHIIEEFLSFYCPINSFIKFEGIESGKDIYIGEAKQSRVC